MNRAEFHRLSLSRKPLARESWNSLPEIFKKLKFLKNLATWNHLRKQSQNGQTQFFNTKNLTFWEKLSKTKWQKSLPKINKILKNLFGIYHQVIEHTHIIFKHAQSHKWNRHLLGSKTLETNVLEFQFVICWQTIIKI